MGINAEDFVKGLKDALCDPSVIGLLKEQICLPLLKEIEGLCSDLAKKDESIGQLHKKVCELELKCDEIEQYSRRNNVRIFGLPEKPEEKLLKDLPDFINKELHVSPPVKSEDICRTHRIGPPRRDGPRAVILKLATYQASDRICSNRSKLKHSSYQVFINEDLTKHRSSLLWKARQMKKEKKITDTWTHDGRILIKTLKGKTEQVASLSCLEAILN